MSLSDLSDFIAITLSGCYAFKLLSSFHSNFGTKFSKGGVYVMPHLNLILQILLIFTLSENIEKYWSNINL